MTVLTKLIVGVHSTWESVKLFIEGTPGTEAPQLTIVASGASTTYEPYDSGKGGWEAELAEGDYILKIEVDDDDWFSGTLQINVVDQTGVTFVVHGGETSPPNRHTTDAWTDSTALVGNDPKDPWPPPGSAASLPSGSMTWFASELHTARVSIATPKAA